MVPPPTNKALVGCDGLVYWLVGCDGLVYWLVGQISRSSPTSLNGLPTSLGLQ